MGTKLVSVRALGCIPGQRVSRIRVYLLPPLRELLCRFSLRGPSQAQLQAIPREPTSLYAV